MEYLAAVATAAGVLNTIPNNGHDYVMVAMANSPNAAAARPAFEALVDWIMGLPVESAPAVEAVKADKEFTVASF